MSHPIHQPRLLALLVLTSLLGALLFAAVPLALADAGDLDPTFGTNGLVTTDLNTTDNRARALTLQSDGQILVAGYTFNGSDDDILLARYTITGTLDPAFGTSGVVTTDINAGWDQANALARQPDGQILVAGTSSQAGTPTIALARYTITGTLDPAFGSSGLVTTPIAAGSRADALVQQPDGQILVAGNASGSATTLALVRYTPDGTLDPTFDTDGIVTTTVGASAGADALVLQPDGKLLAVGTSSQGIVVTRYTSDGALDPTFDTDGIVTTTVGTQMDFANAAALQPDGNLLVAGYSYDDSFLYTDLALLRYTPDGALDPTFGTNGVVTTDISGHVNENEDYGYAVTPQPDGNILVAGQTPNGSDDDFLLVRYRPDGTLDPTFGTNGVVTTDIGNDVARAIARQSDGQILVAGYTVNGADSDVALLRYDGHNLQFDPTCSDTDADGQCDTTAGAYTTLDAAIAAADSGETIDLTTDSALASTTLTHPLTLNLQGHTLTPQGAGPLFTIDTAGVTLQGGTLNGAGGTALLSLNAATNSTSPGVRLTAGTDNFTLKDTEVTGWQDGVQVAGDVTSLKLIGNYVHDNTNAGLRVDPGVTISGVVSIEGNLFKNNGGPGIDHQGTGTLPAPYNNWGDLNGPAGPNGDGVNGTVDTTNYTFAEVFLDVYPDTEATQHGVDEGTPFTVTTKADAATLYALEFDLTYEADKLQYNTLDDAVGFKGSANCDTSHIISGTTGTVSYRCHRQNPDPAYDADGGHVLDLTFTATGAGLAGDGPWSAVFDLDHTQNVAGAPGGVKVHLNNAGFGAPSTPARDITDANDGQIDITGIGQFTGYIDRQGREDDNGVTFTVYDQAAKSGATALANATSAADGHFTTAYLGNYRLTVGTPYWFQADAPLHLPTTALNTSALYPTAPSSWVSTDTLTTRAGTGLNTLTLLGGDATDDDVVDINDAACIGNDYGRAGTGSTCATGNSDVNGDDVIDILDLALMGGNYDKTYSPWTP